MNEAYNVDCMEYMKTLPDNAFDLAVVDPPYGGVTQGGYMKNKMSGNGKASYHDYHLALWQFSKPGKEYFNELFRVAKNQIIWGGTITRRFSLIRKGGSYGTRKSPTKSVLHPLNWRGRRLTDRHEYFGSYGTVCFRVIQSTKNRKYTQRRNRSRYTAGFSKNMRNRATRY